MQVRSLDQEDLLEEEMDPVFLPGRFHRQRSLEGYSPWGHKELDMTEHVHIHTYMYSFLRFLSLIGNYKILSILPCAIQ